MHKPKVNRIHKIVKCSKCGMHAVTISKIALTCPFCRKKTALMKRIKNKGVFSRVIKRLESGRDAAKIVAILNEQKRNI